MEHQDKSLMYGTTILSVRINNEVVVAGDGQVTLGHTIMKSTAKKIRTLSDKTIITGFAGATADAFTLLEKLKEKLEKYPTQLMRSCVELAKDWRTDKFLRKLEAMMIVADKNSTFILTGTGDVLEPESGIAAIGSGGNYALSAAHALIEANPDMSAEKITRLAMKIASDICVYTNNNLIVEKLKSES